MTYPIFKKGQPGFEQRPDGRFGSPSARHIPTLPRDKLGDPSLYVMSKELSDAVNVALILGVPLLVTGEPGTGKTELGRAIAFELEAGEPLKFETKSTSQAKDLFYSFDVLGRYGAKDVGGSLDARGYIAYQALGRAILDAFDWERVSHMLTDKHSHSGPKRSVVIVDEIDKAPRDFPNDLLNEVDRMAFRVPELNSAATPGMDDPRLGVPADLRPIVVITSNSEKGLPEPFLRRCVYFDIAFPKDEQLRDIVASRLSGLTATCRFVDEALNLFRTLRSSSGSHVLSTPPATAQLLDFMQVLIRLGYTEQSSIRTSAACPDLIRALGTLVKQKEDKLLAEQAVTTWCGMASDEKS